MRQTVWLGWLFVACLARGAAPLAYTVSSDGIAGGEALGRMLAARQRAADDVTAALRGGQLPLDGVRVLILGSYVNSDPGVRQTLLQHRAKLAQWLAAGGVVVQFGQQDAIEKRTTWLPGGIVVTRDDPDYANFTWLRPDHPLATTPHRLDAAALGGWRLRHWSIAWEAIVGWDGAERLAATGPGDRAAAVVEAPYGRGRALIMAVSPDSMVRLGEGETPAKAQAFFDNLLHYLDEVVAGRGVVLHPTPPVAPVSGPALGGCRLAVDAAPTSPLLPLLKALGVPFHLAPATPDRATADVLLLDAGRAEQPAAAQQAAWLRFVTAGGVVVELAQNLDRRPLWLEADDTAGRGGHPADFLVPAAATHPLFERPNRLAGSRREALREGAEPVARQPFTATAGWGVVARYGGPTSPAAVLERAAGQGRVVLVAADFRGVTLSDDLAAENGRALLANLLQFAADAAARRVALTPPDKLPDESRMWVGRQLDGSVMVPTQQLIRPAGRQVEFPGRPFDLALLPDGRRLLVADMRTLRLIDTVSGEVVATAGADGGHTAHGLAVTRNGRWAFTSSTKHSVLVWSVDGQQLKREKALPVPGSAPAPYGLALSADEHTLYCCASRLNTLIALPLDGTAARSLDVGVCPYAVRRVGDKLYVTNYGGRRAQPGDRTANSSGTPVVVDGRTLPVSGTVTVVDAVGWKVLREVPVGLLPGGLAADPAGRRLYVANANSDSVSVVDTATDEVVETIAVRPSEALPFGSGVNDVVCSPDGATLYAANGTNNAVAVIRLGRAARADGQGEAASRVAGFIPVGWYPGALALRPDGRELFVANTKGVGSLAQATNHNSHHHEGSVSLVPVPAAAALDQATAQVARNNRLQLALAGLEPPRPGIAPRPLPERHGEPSLLKHVIYIIRENRTYDQVLGDVARGNGDASLVHFGRPVTPNAHALASEFTLLDNFYCSGVLSADGHQWACEGYVTPYLEKSFGGFIRSYPYEGDDALAYAPTGFIWDNVLGHGLTFRSYGEMVQARVKAKTPGRRASFKEIYNAFLAGNVAEHFDIGCASQIQAVRDNSCPTVCGFPATVPDVYRAGEFIKELKQFETNDRLPRLSVLLLPCDHTSGTAPGMPTPQASVADNDLALGRIVDAVSHSKFWPTTAIFVCQDDPQAGLDHVDGHRSPAFVISPYTPRGAVDSANYTQVGMIKTMELILGLPPMHQLDLAAEPMTGCFRAEADLRPFTARPNEIPLDQLNPAVTALTGAQRYWAVKSAEMDFGDVDRIDEDTLNRVLWHATKGYETPYPRRVAARHVADDD